MPPDDAPNAATLLASHPTPTGAPAAAPAPAATATAAAPAAGPAVPTDAAAPAADPAWAAGLPPEARAAVEAELGKFKAPATADEYELPVPDGEDPAFAKEIAPLMHKAGLTAGQAKALATEWNGYVAAQKAAADQRLADAETGAAAKAQREAETLKGEWGEAFDANTEHGRRAFAKGAAAIGSTVDEFTQGIAAMADVLGYAKTLKVMALYGKHFAEDGAPGLGQGATGALPDARKMYENSNMNP